MTAKKSLPKRLVDQVFVRMEGLYGNAFLDKWRDTDIDLVRATWAEGLADVTPDNLKLGIARLFHHPGAPDLPTFIELCKPYTATAGLPSLPDESELTPREEGAHKSSQLLAMARDLADRKVGSIAWAHKVLARPDATAMQVALAEDAVRRWRTTHHQQAGTIDEEAKANAPLSMPKRIPSPHIYADEQAASREPGSDDDLEGEAA